MKSYADGLMLAAEYCEKYLKANAGCRVSDILPYLPNNIRAGAVEQNAAPQGNGGEDATTTASNEAPARERCPAVAAPSQERQLLRSAELFLRIGSKYAPDQSVNDQNKASGEWLKIRGLATTMLHVADSIRALLAAPVAEQRRKVSAEFPICEHGRNAWADDCGMCDAAGTDWAMPAVASPAAQALEGGDKVVEQAERLATKIEACAMVSGSSQIYIHVDEAMQVVAALRATAHPQAGMVMQLPPLTDLMYQAARDSEYKFISEEVLDDIWENINTALRCGQVPAPQAEMVMVPRDTYDALAQLRKDARRYKWLRVQHWNDSTICVVANPKVAVKLDSDCPSDERLDAIVDVAMKAQNALR